MRDGNTPDVYVSSGMDLTITGGTDPYGDDPYMIRVDNIIPGTERA